MRDSVVWVSQKLAPMLGNEALEAYFTDFGYSSRDLSGGLDRAWLTRASFLEGAAKPTLTISADEQARFLARMWRGVLLVSGGAVEKTNAITRLEGTPGGWTLHGKTGSGFVGKDGKKRLGWFVTHLHQGGRSLVAVVRIVDNAAPPKGAAPYAGRQARELLEALLAEGGS